MRDIISVTHEKAAVMDSLNAFIAFWTLESPGQRHKSTRWPPVQYSIVGLSSEASMYIKGSLLLLLIFFYFYSSNESALTHGNSKGCTGQVHYSNLLLK